jgi:hypothetical protein
MPPCNWEGVNLKQKLHFICITTIHIIANYGSLYSIERMYIQCMQDVVTELRTIVIQDFLVNKSLSHLCS